jgi:hypothetical protein
MAPHSDPNSTVVVEANEQSSLLIQHGGGGSSHVNLDMETTSMVRNSNKQGRHSSRSTSSSYSSSSSSSPFSLLDGIKLLAVAGVLVTISVGGGMLWKRYRPMTTSMDPTISTTTTSTTNVVTPPPPPSHNLLRNRTTTNSKYEQVQYFGYQIYTGGAPAFLEQDIPIDATHATTGNKTTTTTTTTTTTHRFPNPECKGLPKGEVILEVDPVLECYLGDKDPIKDVQRRMQIMKDAVEKAYTQASHDPTVLKIFVAPEFFWRGLQGSYTHGSLDTIFSNLCNGPVCAILRGLEDLVQDARFEDWFFLFGTVIASQTLPAEDKFEYLYYNFAPVYKGFDPRKVSDPNKPLGKRFLLPKRYVSDSDFLAKPKLNAHTGGMDPLRVGWEELLGADNQPNMTDNPFYIPRHHYNDNLYQDYKAALGEEAGYAMIEYDWIVLDGITMTVRNSLQPLCLQ